MLRFEFIPEHAELVSLVGWQKSEDAIGREAFAGVLVNLTHGIVAKGVTGIDLHEVVNDDHFQNAQDVELGRVRVFGENDDAKAEVPGVFGVVFSAAALSVQGLPEDLFQFVALSDEFNLANKAIGAGVLMISHGASEVTCMGSAMVERGVGGERRVLGGQIDRLTRAARGSAGAVLTRGASRAVGSRRHELAGQVRDVCDEEVCSRGRLGPEPGGADIDKREPPIAGALAARRALGARTLALRASVRGNVKWAWS